MELKQYARDVLTTGHSSSGFNVELNGAGFEIMSSAIYEHKIIAIIREYACNAYDSHISAGKEDVPFEVTLPNRFTPSLIIEDFGLGLDDDGVRSIFATYFGSTKQASSDLIGGFGLGSKSGFAYTDSFNVTARKDGVERTYVSFIDNNGKPSLTMITEHETSEGNGVKVIIPVQEHDFRTFHDESSIILSMFKTKPIVHNSGFEFMDETIHEQIKENGYALMPKKTRSSLYSDNTFYALVGGVIYPIPPSIIYKLDNSYQLISNGKSTIIPFGIDEVFPAASRERIQMKNGAFDLIVNRINNVLRDRMKGIQYEVCSKPNYYAAAKYVYEKYGNLGLSSLTYGGEFLKHQLNRILCLNIKNANVYGILRRHSYRHTGNKITKASISVKHLIEGAKVTVYHRDSKTPKTGFSSICNRHIRNHGATDNFAVIITNTDDKDLSAHQKRRITEYYGGNVEFIEYDSIRKMFKTASTSTGRKKYDRGEKGDDTIYAKIYEDGEYQKIAHHTIDPTKKYLYVDSERYAINTVYLVPDVIDGAVVLLKSEKNKKRIEELGIEKYTDYLDKMCKEYKDYSDYQSLRRIFYGDGQKVQFLEDKYQTMYAYSEKFKNDVTEYAEKYKELYNKYEPLNLSVSITTAIQNSHPSNMMSSFVTKFKYVNKYSEYAEVNELIQLRLFAEKNGFTPV